MYVSRLTYYINSIGFTRNYIFFNLFLVENTCGKTNNAKVGYFEGTDVGTSQGTCSYTVKLKNTNVCQIRYA